MTIFKSVNIADDLDRASVVESYRPTRKTLQVVRAVCGLHGSRATHVIAPYGAGKSIAALAGITCMTAPSEVAGPLVERIASVAPDLAAALVDAPLPTEVCLLHGNCPDIGSALCGQLGVVPGTDLQGSLKNIVSHARRAQIERIVIVWDEFGQHLETLVREGRSEDLLALQDLAEWAVRRTNPVVTLTTLMHQGVSSFTRRVSDTAQSAWRKIEGRFDTLSLFDDGIDAYEMLADALNRPRSVMTEQAERARAAGFFARIGDVSTIGEILSRTAPLTPAAVDALPKLSAQVAQNERTMMRFLSEELHDPIQDVIGLPELYDYFAPAMRADRGPGGTHRRLVETETALLRATTALQRDILKSATLLQLGMATERVRLPKHRLIFAVSEGSNVSPEEVDAEITALLERKLLLYRRRLDDISVWHGADIDLATMVAEEAGRIALEIDTVSTLQRLFPPDAYVAPRYNHERAITRFARARYVLACDLLDNERREQLTRDAAVEDAFVALVIDGTADRLDLTDAAAQLPGHVITALPRRSVEVTAILTELSAIGELMSQKELLDSDPLVGRELLELKSEAETALRQALDKLINPDRGEVIWMSRGASHDFHAGASQGDLLADLFEQRFALTPHIRNEQIVRKKVTATTRSARKRCVLAVIERSGSPALGYEGATSADASIFRTVFQRTGLYFNIDSDWVWATPAEVRDIGLREVWKKLKAFFSEPSEAPKDFSTLFDELTAPPIGLREGLLPLLVAAGMQAFGRHLGLREAIDGNQRYVEDINPSTIERICEFPNRFTLEVLDLTASQKEILKEHILTLTSEIDEQEPDLIRAFYDALMEWKSGIPEMAFTSRDLGNSASVLQPLLKKRWIDPIEFLLKDFPKALNLPLLSPETFSVFRRGLEEMENVSRNYARRAGQIAADLFNARTGSSKLPLLDAAETWAKTLPVTAEQARELDQEARGILSRAKSATRSPRGEVGFVTTLSGILSGTSFEDWTDESVQVFKKRLDAALQRGESLALRNADGSEAFEPFIKHQLATVFDRFEEKIGRDKLLKYIKDLYREAE